MGIKRVMVQFEAGSGIPKDRVVNTFHFSPGLAKEQLTIPVRDFYTAGSPSVGGFLSPYLDRTAGKTRVKVYDLADPMPREPLDDTFILPASSGGTPLPREVAGCLSYYSDRNIRRQRGRIYLGPLTTSAIENRANDQGLTTAFRDCVKNAALALMDFFEGTEGWIVYSEAEHLAVGAEYAGRKVDHGWVDDAIDIQRRRGVAPLARTAF